MAFVENLSPMFADFGVDATLNGVPVRGIFDDAYGEAFGGMVSGSGPMFRLASSSNAARGQSLIIGAVTYAVTGVEPDGTGLTTLRLDKP